MTTVSLASREAARQPQAGRIPLSRAACSAALGGLTQRRFLVPMTGSAGETSPPALAHSILAVQHALMTALALRTRTRQINMQPIFISLRRRIINPLGLRDKWD